MELSTFGATHIYRIMYGPSLVLPARRLVIEALNSQHNSCETFTPWQGLNPTSHSLSPPDRRLNWTNQSRSQAILRIFVTRDRLTGLIGYPPPHSHITTKPTHWRAYSPFYINHGMHPYKGTNPTNTRAIGLWKLLIVYKVFRAIGSCIRFGGLYPCRGAFHGWLECE